MARKKMTRTAKGKKMQAKSKTKTKTAALSLTEKMERDFRDAPAKIAAQYDKEIAVLKQQESKLTAELTKANALQKALKAKNAVVSSKKLTAAAKKRLAAAKKAQDQLVKAIKDFTAKLEQIKQTKKALSDKQATIVTISKEIAKLEKQLALKARKASKAKSLAKTKKKTAKKAKKSASVHIEPAQNEELNVVETVAETEETVA